MKIHELKKALADNPEATIRFQLPNGECVAAHAHVTEAARIDKRFVDCGGTFREESLCRLQTWVHDDVDHRLHAQKLSKILDKAKAILISDDLDVDIEHEIDYISQFPLESVELSGSELVLKLTTRHTACLAMDQCCPPEKGTDFFTYKPAGFELPTLNLPAR